MTYLMNFWRTIQRRPFDDITLFLCIAAGIGYVVTQSLGLWNAPDALTRGVALAVVLVGLVALNALEARLYPGGIPALAAVGLLVARAVIIELAVALESFGVANMLYLILPMKAFLYFPPLPAYSVSFALLGIFFLRLNIVKPLWFTSVTGAYTFILFTAGVVLASYAAQLIARERRSRLHAEKLLEDLEVSHQRLARYARQAAESATLEERNRLARDIHDGLGHYLTALNIQLEKAAVFHSRSPEESLQALRDARRLSSEALDDVRQSVGALRDTAYGFRLEDALRRLTETVEGSDLQIRLVIEGGSAGYSNQALLALYRAAQEGLTNVQRHASAQQATLHVCFGDTVAVMTLHDDGVGFDADARSAGSRQAVSRYGLVGVEERLTLVDGRLTVSSQPGAGTTLTVRVPREHTFGKQA
jgi:signal transduction histidine kinase